jgi:SHS2 domain-containing protein
MLPPEPPPWLHEIDHTGDIGIRVTATTLGQLYERAAEGTFHVLTDLAEVQPAEEQPVEVRGRDREALLVRWLSELNYRHTVDDWLFSAFEVRSIEDIDGELVLNAVARGEHVDSARHVVHTEIKAITFHGLDVRETDDGWVVQVIFDM